MEFNGGQTNQEATQMTNTAKTYLLHFDARDGAFTLEREAHTLRGAYSLALELTKGRADCYVKGVEEKSTQDGRSQ